MLVAALVAVASQSPAWGEPLKGPYLAGRGLIAVSAISGTSTNSTADLEIRHDRDVVAVVEVAYGYGWAGRGVPIRTEVAYQHRFRFDYDTRLTGAQTIGFEDNVRSDSLLFSAAYDFGLFGNVGAYVGVGVGWTRNVSQMEREILGNGIELRTDVSNAFTWMLMTGFTVPLAPKWTFEVGYRYIDLGRVESGPFSSGTVIEADSYVSHDVVLGILYKF